MKAPGNDRAELARTYRLLFQPGQVTELRALEVPSGRYTSTVSGYFDNEEALVNAAAGIVNAYGVYVVLNPIKTALLSRAMNRARAVGKKDPLTSDGDMLRRFWLPLDADPVRPAGISSSDEEHTAALARMGEIKAELVARGWPDFYTADSGNGAHGLPAIDLAADDAGLVSRVLKALGQRFDDDAVEIDQSVSNASRIWKFYGTWARKGDSTPERPHRLARWLHTPDEVQVVPVELLEELASTIKPEASHHATPKHQHATSHHANGSEFDLEAWIKAHNLAVDGPEDWPGGGAGAKRWVFKVCPWNAAHTDHSAFVGKLPDGRSTAGCQHNGCADKTWQDLRVIYEPDAYAHKAKSPKKGKGKEAATDSPDQESDDQESAAAALLRIGAQATFYCTPSGEIYAKAKVNGHEEVWTVGERGSGLRSWLIYEYHKETGKAPNSNALTNAMHTLSARALFEGERREVFTRVGHHDGVVYLDLADARWRVVRISREGWEITTKCPILFRRPRGMLPLEAPRRGGSLDGLRLLLNLGADGDGAEETERRIRLIGGWLTGCLNPHGPYAHLNLFGERGTAKSTSTRTLRNLIDPNQAAARAMPKEPRDIYIAAKNGHIVGYDNLSHLPEWFSDELCRLATGQASATRALYSDDDEVIFNAKRPCIFNGIGELATRGDLLDRLLSVELPIIDDEDRLTERAHQALYVQLAPGILGALCNGVVSALRRWDDMQIANLPRLADFAQWVEAAAPAYGWTPEAFLDDFRDNQESGTATELEASPVAGAIIRLFNERYQGEGVTLPPTRLLEELTDLVAPVGDDGKRGPKPKNWPSNARALSLAIPRVAPALRRRNISIQSRKSHGTREWILAPRGTQGGRKGDAKGASGDARGTQKNGLASPEFCEFYPENGPAGDAKRKGDAKSPHLSPSIYPREQRERSRHNIVGEGENNGGGGMEDDGRDFASLAPPPPPPPEWEELAPSPQTNGQNGHHADGVEVWEI